MKFTSNINSQFDDNVTNLSVTPLIDITFCLLLFFVLTTTFIQTNSMGITLPSSASGQQQAVAQDLVVTIDAQGQISADNKQLSISELKDVFTSWRAKSSQDLTVIIWGDQTSQHGTIVAVMDAAKSAGIERLAIATNKLR